MSDLSEKRAAAGRKGAAARWAKNDTTAGAPGDGLVCGTAAELREMAEAAEQRNTPALTRARAVSATRVRAYRGRHPEIAASELVGRVVCEALPDSALVADAPKLRLVNETADEAELWIYDTIDSWGGYWGISAAEVVESLADVTASRINVHINSPGGEVFEGIAIKRALAAHPADITVSIDSVAASIASVIAMAGDPICIDSAAMIMIHDASGFCLGNATDMHQMAALLDKISDVIAGVYANRAGDDVPTWRARMLAETWYTAAEALDAGLADEYLDPPAETTEEAPAAHGAPRVLAALVATATPQPEPPKALSLLRAVKEAANR
jgi:ATP-dependent protease ClpP protease subunit